VPERKDITQGHKLHMKLPTQISPVNRIPRFKNIEMMTQIAPIQEPFFEESGGTRRQQLKIDQTVPMIKTHVAFCINPIVD